MAEQNKWRCDACGEAENCDAKCIVNTAFDIPPEFCPVSGDECEWELIRQKAGE